MVIKNAELETVVGVTTKGFPKHELPEIAFAGRSNVGKSSLINVLLNRKSLARTSATPGKTQTINFYNVNKEFYFVDLPGYGYAKVKVDFKAQWGPMIERYLRSSAALRNVFLLVDMRRPPTPDDMMMYEWVSRAGFKPVIIATKADKLKRSQFKEALRAVREAYPRKDIEVIAFSALSRQGREEIIERIEEELSD
ncbi:MAG: YihA family ribosome biogenesis GTP-binding protein [Lachnospiraceae bacterium]|nr:YihA family ribosome biogenesis GTP-binding protein [Lachnospiraceae bacterium]